MEDKHVDEAEVIGLASVDYESASRLEFDRNQRSRVNLSNTLNSHEADSKFMSGLLPLLRKASHLLPVFDSYLQIIVLVNTGLLVFFDTGWSVWWQRISQDLMLGCEGHCAASALQEQAVGVRVWQMSLLQAHFVHLSSRDEALGTQPKCWLRCSGQL